MTDLKQKYGETAMVTGASSGIGKAYARALAAAGLNLILVARRDELLKELGTELANEFGISVDTVAQDLTAADAASQVAAAVRAMGKEVDLLFNNAGVGIHDPFERIDRAKEQAMITLNCQLPVALTHEFLPAMQSRGRGAIVFIASVAGHMPVPNMATYSGTKAFILLFGESLYQELLGSGIDVLVVSPGDTVTEFREVADLQNEFPVPARTAEQVCATTLNALGKRPSVIDGMANVLFARSASFTPRKSLLKMNQRLWKA